MRGAVVRRRPPRGTNGNVPVALAVAGRGPSVSDPKWCLRRYGWGRATTRKKIFFQVQETSTVAPRHRTAHRFRDPLFPAEAARFTALLLPRASKLRGRSAHNSRVHVCARAWHAHIMAHAHTGVSMFTVGTQYVTTARFSLVPSRCSVSTTRSQISDFDVNYIVRMPPQCRGSPIGLIPRCLCTLTGNSSTTLGASG